MVERSEKFSHPPKTFATNVNSFATLETRCGLQENKNINDSKQLDDKKPKKRKQISEYVEYNPINESGFLRLSLFLPLDRAQN